MRKAIVGLVAVACMALGPNAQAYTVMQETYQDPKTQIEIRMPADRETGRIVVSLKGGGGYHICLETVGTQLRAKWIRVRREGGAKATGGDSLTYAC